MPETVVYEDASLRVIEATSATPDAPGGWRSHRTEFKPGSTGDNEAQLKQRASAALAVNATYLALVTPTNAQVAAQVQRLTRECSALIRLLLKQADSLADS